MALGSGAALHREARRLVEDDDLVVAVEDRVACSIASSAGEHAGAAPAALRAVGASERRDADRLARRHPVAGLGALAVDPDLAGAQQLFEPAMGERRIMPPEPAVEAQRRRLGRRR